MYKTPNAKMLVEWNTEVVPKCCEECGARFEGSRQKRFCESCLTQHQKEDDAKYYRDVIGPRRRTRMVLLCMDCGEPMEGRKERRYCDRCVIIRTQTPKDRKD